MSAAFSLRRSVHGVEHNALVFRHSWIGVLAVSLGTPLLFLLSMGIGLGGYVNSGSGASRAIGGVSYLEFLAPGLLAAQAMMTGANDASYPIMSRIIWQKTYQAILNTPLGVSDVVAAEFEWIALRLTLVCGLFLAVEAALGALTSPLAILALPASVLTGLAFAAPIMAFTATQRNDQSFKMLFRFGVTPLFLFGGTFFPVDSLPALIRPLAWLTPLWHGAEVTRALALGRVDALALAVHLVVLAGFVAVGLAAALVTYRRRLTP